MSLVYKYSFSPYKSNFQRSVGACFRLHTTLVSANHFKRFLSSVTLICYTNYTVFLRSRVCRVYFTGVSRCVYDGRLKRRTCAIVCPNAQIFGCLFHLTKNHRKQLRREQLSARYGADPAFRFDALSDELPDELGRILDWFENSYLGSRNRRGITETGNLPTTDVECLRASAARSRPNEQSRRGCT